MRVILTALAVPGFALGLATAAGTLMKDEVPVYDQPTSVVWADRVYSNKHDFAMWLSSRGARYRVWAARHPALAEVLEPGRVQKLTRPTTPARRLAGDSPRSADSRQSTLAIGVVLASALGLLGLFATLRLRRPHAARAGPPRRSVTPSPQGKPRLGRAQLVNAGATIAASTAGVITGTRRGLAALEHRVTAQRAATAATAHATTLRRPVHLHALAHRRRSLGHGLARSLIGPARVVTRTLSALRGAWAALERRRRARREQDDGWRGAESAPILARATLRQHAPDIALYVTSALLALVVGSSIALYLN